MSSPAMWAAGRYEALADHIAHIATQVVDAADRHTPVRDTPLLDLACGTGIAALEAAARGARVTAIDYTPELVAIAAQKARAAGRSITFRTADASATGLSAQSFDATVSNMGIIFVEPSAQVAELERLMKPDAMLAFSSWVHDDDNPFFDPIVEVLGPRPKSEYSPDQWGDPEIIDSRLSRAFDDIELENGVHTWRFPSLDAAFHFMTRESPSHVTLLGTLDERLRAPLLTAFETALRAHTDDDGNVAFDSPYLVVTARRR